MATEKAILTVAGWQGSPAEHWQSLWEAGSGGRMVRVPQRDWDQADRTEWVRALDVAVAWAPGPVVLVAHSLGVITVAHWAAVSVNAGRVSGAFLVAPPDVECPVRCPDCLRSFAPLPRWVLPFPTLVVGSDNDPYATPERVMGMAASWGAEYVSAGTVGHINVSSGHGAWPEGETLFTEFLAGL